MRRFYTITTPTDRIPFDYVTAGFTMAVSLTRTRFSEQDDEYDDDEEYEKEWCD